MRYVLTLFALGSLMFGGLVGCEASGSARVSDDDHTTTTVKKTTVREDDGARTVKSEVRKEY